MPSHEGVVRAAQKVAKILPPTPLLPLMIRGKTIWCKAEALQPIGAFKIRGAWHRLTDLSEKERKLGVVAFSSGNHAQGIAWAAKQLNINATIVMPSDAPKAKMKATKDLGAEIIIYNRMTESREEIARDIALQNGATIVPSFDDAWVIEGQGSTAIEAAQQLSAHNGQKFDQIIACCGGGGLASGCALALLDAEICIVEPDGWDDMGQSLTLGKIVPVRPNPPFTSCDALQTLRVCDMTFNILHERCATGVNVTEAEIAAAMRYAYENLHIILEPGGAVALAAIIAGKVELGQNPLVTLSGGNVDAALYFKMIGG
ncbi:pyridoxal-5'-phosphate-dependent protein [Sphingorhabdus lutea]|uniref:Pyridoxal-5'-phosphate-dependent protein n=2 Tax=Sphingorhabdus lutea TaxID=1913578 RepID=A0A1L3JEW7_9SPHN|nr:pyridoxal-5'-phosphate-dependent protein [Sphingorhabdus lutea]